MEGFLFSWGGGSADPLFPFRMKTINTTTDSTITKYYYYYNRFMANCPGLSG